MNLSTERMLHSFPCRSQAATIEWCSDSLLAYSWNWDGFCSFTLSHIHTYPTTSWYGPPQKRSTPVVTSYAVLGDDVLISDTMVNRRWLSDHQLGLSISANLWTPHFFWSPPLSSPLADSILSPHVAVHSCLSNKDWKTSFLNLRMAEWKLEPPQWIWL